MINYFAKALYLHPVISWLVTIAGIGVLISPSIVAWWISKQRFPQWMITSIGICFGFSALPLSLWLYMQYYVGPVRALIFGFLGLFMIMLHMAPLSNVTIPLLLEATDATAEAWGTPILKEAIVGGLIWAAIYGGIGLISDLIRKKVKDRKDPKTFRGNVERRNLKLSTKVIISGILGLIAVFVLFITYVRFSDEPNWQVEENAVPSETHPLAGFWKEEGCGDPWGWAIGPIAPGKYYISFCGPGGCFEEGTYRPNTTIVDDPEYRVVDENTIMFSSNGVWSKLVRCPGRT